MADLDTACQAMFKLAVEKCAGKELPEAEKTVCKSNAVNKILKEAFDAKTANAVDATIFCKYCDKTTKKLTLDAFMKQVLPDLAKHRLTEAKKKVDDAALAEELEKLKKKIVEKYNEWMSAEKKGNMAVVDRLTDVKGYTGSHKERFDAESGKGKGMEGRMDKADNSGYVGNYKGAGTYDKSH